ncbi:MAG: M28 family peptidase [Actinobacteria bacterium]|nr:M28 family peptidase [Actinomycetota bacterium]
MDLPSKHVLHLSKRIGARGAGSDGEAAAASYVLRTLDDFDIEVNMESFSCWKSDLTAFLILYLLAIASYLLFRYSYTLSFVVSVAVFLLFLMETLSWAVISKLLPRSNVSNVMARVRPSEETRRRVVLTANYDSAKSSPLGRPCLARSFRVLFIVSFICIIFIVILGIVGLLASLTKETPHTIYLAWVATVPFPLFLFLFFMVIFWGEVRGHYTAGANDNASGLGVILSVISSIADNPLEHTDVWAVATGRGAAGGRGMVALLHRHRRQLKDAFIINVDHVGVGKTSIITREGVMLGFRCSWKLRRLARAAANKSKDLDVGKGRCRVKKSDAMVARVRGYKSMTIGGQRGGSYPGWKNSDDTSVSIDRESLDDAMKLLQLLLEEIDAQS